MKLAGKIILSLIFLAVLLVSESNSWDPPFGITISRGTQNDRVIKDQVFGMHICLEAYDGDITNLKMSIQIPPEVEKLSGEASWQGELSPKKEKSLYLKLLALFGIHPPEKEPTILYKKCIIAHLKAKKNIGKWSSPIHGRLRFIYDGKKCARDVVWSDKGFKDTGWLSEGSAH